MFAQLSRLMKHSVVYGLAETVSRGIGFLLTFIYVRAMTVDDVGLRSTIYGAAAFLGPFYTLGLDNAFLRYYMDRTLNAERRREVFASAMTFTLIVGVLLLAVVVPFSGVVSQLTTESASYSGIIVLLFTILILDNVVVYPTLVLRAENRLGYYTLVAAFRFFIFIGLNLWLVWYAGRGLRGVFEANLIAVVLIALLLAPVYRQLLPARVSIKVLKRMLAFGVPTIFTLLSMQVINISDRYVLLYAVGKQAVGFYYPVYMLGMVAIMVFINSFRLAWQPFFLAEKESAEAPRLFSRVTTYYALFIGMVLLGLTLFRDWIFTFYAPEYPSSLANLMPLVALGHIFYGLYIIMLAGIYIRDKTWVLPVAAAVAAVVNVALNLLLIPRYGIPGAVWATVAAYATLASIMYRLTRRVYHVPYEFGRLGFVAGVTALPALLSLVWRPEPLMLDLLWRASLLALPVVVYLAGGFLNDDERAQLVRVARTLALRKGADRG